MLQFPKLPLTHCMAHTGGLRHTDEAHIVTANVEPQMQNTLNRRPEAQYSSVECAYILAHDARFARFLPELRVACEIGTKRRRKKRWFSRVQIGTHRGKSGRLASSRSATTPSRERFHVDAYFLPEGVAQSMQAR